MTALQYFGSVKTSSEFAYRRLEQMVVSLELKPGSQTTEAELQSRVGVGRTPVREAVQRLAWEGLLEIRPRSGVRIAPLTGRDWLQMMAVRRHVELVLARTAAQNGTRQSRQMLETATDLMQQAIAARDMSAYVAADKLFDIAVAESTGNCHLVRAAFPLQTHARRFWMHFHGTNGVDSSLQQHLKLADAIMAQDVARSVKEAKKLMSYVQAEASRALEIVQFGT